MIARIRYSYIYLGHGDNCQAREVGTGKIVPCSFPFKINGRKFDQCTDFLDPEGKLWCSTRTDPKTHNHVDGQGFWGYCNDRYCPEPMSKIFHTQFSEMNIICLVNKKY